jgi:hypothetical protein
MVCTQDKNASSTLGRQSTAKKREEKKISRPREQREKKVGERGRGEMIKSPAHSENQSWGSGKHNRRQGHEAGM